MMLSTRSRYGIRALTALADQQPAVGRCARELAEEEKISKKYLESILARLRAAGIIRSVRGAQGGYMLAKDPEELTVGEIIHALEGSLAFAECIDDAGCCDRTDSCVSRDVWVAAETALVEALDGFTLASLVAKRTARLSDLPH